MASDLHHNPHRPLLDPLQLEAAGRAFRHWLDRLLGQTPPQADADIAWEDGEPKDDGRDGARHGH